MFQMEDVLALRLTLLEVPLNEATGDIAVPLATSVLARAASTST